MIRVLLADDHAILRAGLRALLATQADLDTVGEAGDGQEAIRLAEALRPDVLLLDVTMPGNEQLAVLQKVRALAPDVRVLLLTMHQDETLLREALKLGAKGYVLKKAAESDLLTAIRAVAQGDAFIDPTMMSAIIRSYVSGQPPQEKGEGYPNGLTGREIEVLTLTAQGYANKEIAARLSISVKTVETHRSHLNEKLGIRSRVELIRYAREKGLLDAG